MYLKHESGHSPTGAVVPSCGQKRNLPSLVKTEHLCVVVEVRWVNLEDV